MRSLPCLILFFGASAFIVPLAAQTPPTPPPQVDTADEEPEIVVTGQRERGAVASDIPPELQLRAADIRALGASSVAEILSSIAAQTGSANGSGRPVILLAGRRISGFDEVRDLPSEAISRIDILPEEVALKFGYRADQKVVNIVLRRRFRAATVEVVPTLATEGGREQGRFKLGLLQIGEGSRTSINGEYEHLEPLYESQRNIAAIPGSLFDQRPFRSLLAGSDRLALNGTVNRSIFGNVSATLNGRIEDTASRTQFGAINPDDPLSRREALRTAHLGAVLSGDLLPWRWSWTANADRTRGRITGHNALNPATQDLARAADQTLSNDFVATGPLFKLPAGDVTSTIKGGFTFDDFKSSALRGGVSSNARLARDTASVQGNLDIPVASRRSGTLAALGDLSFNLNLARDRLSDFGTLSTWGYGFNWSPVKPLELIASVTDTDGAPSVQQLGNPLIVTSNIRVFDFARGETVNIVRLNGGNPGLDAQNRRLIKLGATLKPLRDINLTLRADYTKSRVRDAIASFPTLTPAIEAAFPGRVTRDASGRLVQLDARPINFGRTNSDQLRWGINFSKAVGKAPPPPSDDVLQKLRAQFGNRPPDGGGDGNRRPPGGEGRRSGPGGGGFRDFGRTQLQFGLFHTWHLRESILIASGLPVLDLLNGGATGSSGGQPRHEVELQAGLTKRGIGARITGNWQSATEVRASPFGLTSSSHLNFSSLTTFTLRLFASFNSQPAVILKHPWLRDLRVRLSVVNIFDARPKVRDAAGVTPFGYQPDLLDPLGRTISISVRKQFR